MHLAALLGLGLLPAAAAAQGFSLYQGSEASFAYGHARDVLGAGDNVDTVRLDTRHTLWLAPFLGSQIDLGASRVDWAETYVNLGLHLHVLGEGGNRFGAFYQPAWFDGLDERVDSYGVEAMLAATPQLTIEARGGRFDSDDTEGPFVGANGFWRFSDEIVLTAGFQYVGLEAGPADIDVSDVLFGAEYHVPASNLRFSGGLGAVRYAGDIDTTTDFQIQFGATLFAFGADGSGASRTRSFGRQTVPGLY